MAFGLVLTAGCASTKTSEHPQIPVVDDVCRLLEMPEGREIRLLATYRMEMDGGSLFDRRYCLPLTWISFSEASRPSALRRLEAARWVPGYYHERAAVVVLLRGRFACNGPYGHEGAYQCEFAATALEKVLGQFTPTRD